MLTLLGSSPLICSLNGREELREELNRTMYDTHMLKPQMQ